MRRLRRLVLIPIAAVLLLVVAVALAELIARSEPVTIRPTTTADYVQLQADERLFTLFAALNAAGYDEENNAQGMSPVRQQVRAELAGKSLSSLAGLQPYFSVCRLIHISQCATWILQRGPVPDFVRAVDGWWLSVPAFPFLGFDRNLRAFYLEADIAGLWHKYRPAYEAEVARYQTLAAPAIDRVFTYLTIERPATDGVRVLPNLLDAYWRGYGPRVGNLAYIVMGPALDPNIGLIQHEAMHPLLNDLIDAHLAVIDSRQSDRLFTALKPRVSAGYQTWPNIVHENVIRAVEVRLAAPGERERIIQREEGDGFLLVRPLAERLADFEQSGQSITAYMPTLLVALNDDLLLR